LADSLKRKIKKDVTSQPIKAGASPSDAIKNSIKNKLVRSVALVGFTCRYWSVSQSSCEDPVKPATCINNYRLQCLLGGLRSNNRIAANCEPYNRRDVVDAKRLASVTQREKRQEKLK